MQGLVSRTPSQSFLLLPSDFLPGRGQMRILFSLAPMDLNLPSEDRCLRSFPQGGLGKRDASPRGAWLDLCAL